MKNTWFKKIAWLYLPSSWQGWLIIFVLLVWCVHIFLFIDSRSHSVSDTLYGIFPFVVPAFLLYIWLGQENSNKL